MTVSFLLFNVIWIIVNFFIPIMQSHFSTILYDESGKLTLILLIKDPIFWISIVVAIAGNITILIWTKRRQRIEDDRIEQEWLRDLPRLIRQVEKRTKKGDYYGATETIKIIKELERIEKRRRIK